MRKLALSLLLLLAAVAGCSAEAKETKKDIPEKHQERTMKQKDVYVPNPQVPDDLHLVKIGETASDEKGEITLKAYKKVGQTITVGPVEMLVKDVKILHYNPDYSMIDFFRAFTHEDEFDLVKVSVEFKNTSDKTVKFNPIAGLTLSGKEHKTWEDDIFLEELAGKIGSSQVKMGNIGFIIDSKQENKWIQFITSDVLDVNNEIIAKAKEVKTDL